MLRICLLTLGFRGDRFDVQSVSHSP
jgi:hypothetical protein